MWIFWLCSQPMDCALWCFEKVGTKIKWTPALLKGLSSDSVILCWINQEWHRIHTCDAIRACAMTAIKIVWNNCSKYSPSDRCCWECGWSDDHVNAIISKARWKVTRHQQVKTRDSETSGYKTPGVINATLFVKHKKIKRLGSCGVRGPWCFKCYINEVKQQWSWVGNLHLQRLCEIYGMKNILTHWHWYLKIANTKLLILLQHKQTSMMQLNVSSPEALNHTSFSNIIAWVLESHRL